MNQTIGIEYTATGYEKVTRTFLALSKSLDKFIAKVGLANTALKSLKENLAISKMFGGQVEGVRELTTALTAFNAAAERNKKVTGRRGIALTAPSADPKISKSKTIGEWRKSQAVISYPPYQKGSAKEESGAQVIAAKSPKASKKRSGINQSSGRQDGSGMPWALGAFPYALRWGGTAAAIYGGASLAKSTLLGGSRTETVKGLRDVAALGFNKKELRGIEDWADQFVKKNWVAGNQSDMLDVFSEIGSAFDPERSPYFKNPAHGAATIKRMSEQAAILASVSKMAPGAGGKLLAGALQAQLAFMKPDELELYKKGIKDIGDLSGSTAAKIGEAIKVTAIWGTEIQQAFGYELPGALQSGWSLESVLSYSGMLKTAGIPATKAARALRGLMETGPEDMAYLWLAGNEDAATSEKFKALKESDRKKLAKQFAPEMKSMFSKDPFGFGRYLGERLIQAEKNNFMLGDIFDTDFTQIIRAFLSPEMLERMKQVRDTIGGATMESLEKRSQETADDPGGYQKRISDAWGHMTRQLALLAGQTESMPAVLDAMLKPMYSVIEWLKGQKTGLDLTQDVSNLVGQLSWGAFQAAFTPIRWATNFLLEDYGVNLQWQSFAQFKEAVDAFLNQFRYFWTRLEDWMREGAKWIVEKLNTAEKWTEETAKAAGAAIQKGLPIAPDTPQWQGQVGLAPPWFNKFFGGGGQVALNGGVGAGGQPVTVNNNETIRLESKVMINQEEIGRAVEEYMRGNTIQRGVGYGDGLEGVAGGY